MSDIAVTPESSASPLAVIHSEETAEYWVGRIRPHLAGAVGSIVAAGRELRSAKTRVDHGEFGRIPELLGMTWRSVDMFMAIAKHEVLTDSKHVSNLPASWGTLYQLSRMSAPALETAIEAGEVTPTLERKAAQQLVARYRMDSATDGEPAHVPEPVEGTFTTIVADPPWQYDNRATRAAAEDHYPTLTIAELCSLKVDDAPVVERAAPDAHLYLWTTNAFLHPAFEVMEAWGFTYKTCLVWVKPQMGIGNYFRSSHEFILFGVRGNLRVLDGNQMSWFQARRGRHSRKPDFAYELIERVSPGPFLELFGRPDPLLGSREGWTVWGNEA